MRALQASKIRELFNAGFGRTDLLAFWVGEPDEPTPEFIRKAGIDSIAAGETFYTHNLGIPEIREALAAYLGRLHPGFSGREAVATSAGVNALMIATQLLVEPGEMRAIIGPNGAGKTTMMDVITGKTRPDSGEVVFDGRADLTKLDEADIATLGIGRKFQKPTVFETHTVRDNLLLALAGLRSWYKLLLATPTKAEICPRLSRPNSGNSATSVWAVTTPTPGVVCSLAARHCNWSSASIKSDSSCSILRMSLPSCSMAERRLLMTALVEAVSKRHVSAARSSTNCRRRATSSSSR